MVCQFCNRLLQKHKTVPFTRVNVAALHPIYGFDQERPIYGNNQEHPISDNYQEHPIHCNYQEHPIYGNY